MTTSQTGCCEMDFSTAPIERSINQIGVSSYSVILPQDWIRAHCLERGEKVFVCPQEDGTVVIATNPDAVKKRSVPPMFESPGMRHARSLLREVPDYE